MLIPRDIWELAASVPLPKILNTSSPSSTETLPTSGGDPLKPSLSTSGDPLKPTEPVASSLLQQSSAILHKSSAGPPSSQTTVEDWISEAPWVEVITQILGPYIWEQHIEANIWGKQIIDNTSVTDKLFQAFLNSPWLQETGAGRNIYQNIYEKNLLSSALNIFTLCMNTIVFSQKTGFKQIPKTQLSRENPKRQNNE